MGAHDSQMPLGTGQGTEAASQWPPRALLSHLLDKSHSCICSLGLPSRNTAFIGPPFQINEVTLGQLSPSTRLMRRGVPTSSQAQLAPQLFPGQARGWGRCSRQTGTKTPVCSEAEPVLAVPMLHGF